VAILTVGPNGQFSTIAAAIAASPSGDVIQVQAGTYTNDFAKITDNITLEAVGGRVSMVATEPPLRDKGIFIIGDGANAPNVTIDGFNFSGAAIGAHQGGNAGGIRYQGGNLTLSNDVFVNNQDGLLATPFIVGDGTITIDHTEFSNNGSGTGFTHNLYVGKVASLTITNSYFNGVSAGHEIKSRAAVNVIENNRILDLNGTASYSIDLPNGGQDVIADNVIEKGLHSQTGKMISFYEGIHGHWANSSLTVSNNVFLDDLATRSATAIWNTSTILAAVSGNSFFNVPTANVVLGPADITASTFLTTEPSLDTADPFLVPVSAGNLDALDGASMSAGDLYSLHVTSYATSGTGTGESITSITANVGSSDFFEGTAIQPGSTFTVSAFDDTQDSIAVVPGSGLGQPVPIYVPGFTPTAMLLSTLPSNNIAIGLDSNISQDLSLAIFSTRPIAGGTTVTLSAGSSFTDSLNVVCYRAGTHIATEYGETLVENMRVGELVRTRFSGLAPVLWIGRRSVDCRWHLKLSKIWAVRVAAGSFGKNLPHRDLWLSPDHAVFVNDVLIPIKYLINDSTIRRIPTHELTYYHIELPQHDVLFAENLPAESYLDTGNRSDFANGGPVVTITPEFSSLTWDAKGCARLVVVGPEVDSARRRIACRVAELGQGKMRSIAPLDKGTQNMQDQAHRLRDGFGGPKAAA
jgi:hypothetical protein